MQIETTEGMDGEDTKLYVAELITSQLQQESFQLNPEQAGIPFVLLPALHFPLWFSTPDALDRINNSKI